MSRLLTLTLAIPWKIRRRTQDAIGRQKKRVHMPDLETSQRPSRAKENKRITPSGRGEGDPLDTTLETTVASVSHQP